MRLPVSNQYQPKPYLAPFSHRHSWQTDGRTDGRITITTKGRP